MQTTYLQSIIRANALVITQAEGFIKFLIGEAQTDTKRGEKAFAIDGYKHASKRRVKLAKLVAVQKALKTELKAAVRLARIDRKIAKLQSVGFVYAKPELTSVEIETALDQLLYAFVPRKEPKDTFGM